MELTSLISQLADAGITDIAALVIVVLYVRYSASETRREISKEIEDRIGSAKSDLVDSNNENRQEIGSIRTDLQESIIQNRQEIGSARTDLQESIIQNRQEIGAVRTDLQESNKENRQAIVALRTDLQESIIQNRQEIGSVRTESRQEFNAARTYSEQSHKEIMLHLIDVRERLANIEGRLGAPTPRMSAVSPPLESPEEEPSAQS